MSKHQIPKPVPGESMLTRGGDAPLLAKKCDDLRKLRWQRARAERLTDVQLGVLEHLGKRGGVHVFLAGTTRPDPDSKLAGRTWEGVRLSLRSLAKRGLLTADRNAFYTLTDAGWAASGMTRPAVSATGVGE